MVFLREFNVKIMEIMCYLLNIFKLDNEFCLEWCLVISVLLRRLIRILMKWLVKWLMILLFVLMRMLKFFIINF